MTKILIDSADLNEIKEIYSTGIAVGVTTNPSLVASQVGKKVHLDRSSDRFQDDYVPCMLEIKKILESSRDMSQAHLSVEVISLDPNEMVDQALKLRKHLVSKEFYMYQRHVNIFVKIPFGLQWLPVIRRLTHEEEIFVNATAITTAKQAILASKAGAQIVSFFYNRMKDHSIDPISEIKTFMKTDGENEKRAQIICGSIRKPEDIVQCFELGVEYVTISPKVIREMCVSEPTEKAVKKFQEDIDSWLK